VHVAWKEYEGLWFASIGPCRLMVRPMDWSDTRARDHRDAVIENRAWVFAVYHYPDALDIDSRVTLTEGAFEVVRVAYDGGVREAQERVVELARELDLCRRQRQRREAPPAEDVAWLDDKIMEILQSSYARWRENNARLRAQAEAGDKLAQEVLYSERITRRPTYPEPRWSTARLAAEVSQYSLPDALDDLSDKRFYQAVHSALERLRRRRLVASSTGPDDQGRETRLWEPV